MPIPIELFPGMTIQEHNAAKVQAHYITTILLIIVVIVLLRKRNRTKEDTEFLKWLLCFTIGFVIISIIFLVIGV